MADDKSPPKQELLLKMLCMTTSDNDGQALVAIRKANKLLTDAGWSWERLLAGKITVVADPFANIQSPKSSNGECQPYNTPRPPPAPPGPSPTVRPAPAPPPPSPVRDGTRSGAPTGVLQLTNKINQYPGWCFCCGNNVPSQVGFVFDPSKHNSRAASKWVTICTKCNTDKYIRVPPSPARRNTPLHPSIDPAIQSGPAPKLGDL